MDRDLYRTRELAGAAVAHAVQRRGEFAGKFENARRIANLAIGQNWLRRRLQLPKTRSDRFSCVSNGRLAPGVTRIGFRSSSIASSNP